MAKKAGSVVRRIKGTSKPRVATKTAVSESATLFSQTYPQLPKRRKRTPVCEAEKKKITKRYDFTVRVCVTKLFVK